jgi:hypothetical protein
VRLNQVQLAVNVLIGPRYERGHMASAGFPAPVTGPHAPLCRVVPCDPRDPRHKEKPFLLALPGQ